MLHRRTATSSFVHVNSQIAASGHRALLHSPAGVYFFQRFKNSVSDCGLHIAACQKTPFALRIQSTVPLCRSSTDSAGTPFSGTPYLLRQLDILRPSCPMLTFDQDKVLLHQFGIRALMKINVQHLAVAAPVPAKVQDHALVRLAGLRFRAALIIRPGACIHLGVDMPAGGVLESPAGAPPWPRQSAPRSALEAITGNRHIARAMVLIIIIAASPLLPHPPIMRHRLPIGKGLQVRCGR
jgi:hypothetical protein